MFSKMNGLERCFWVVAFVVWAVGTFGAIALLPEKALEGQTYPGSAYLGFTMTAAGSFIIGLLLMALARILLHLRTIAEELPGLQGMIAPASAASMSTGASPLKTSLATASSGWTCKCGTTNPMKAIRCQGCGEYR